MQYHVVPFTARITQKDTTAEVAKQLETLIQHYAAQGLEYVRLETVQTLVKGSNGCFGLGATPDSMSYFRMAVFVQR